jgi:hypothetical protein
LRGVADWYDEYELLIADSSVLFRFFESGADVTTALITAIGHRIHLVEIVDQEIERYRNDPQFADGIAAFRAAQVNVPLEPRLEVTRQVQRIVEMQRKLGMGTADLGEYETVLMADHEWDEGPYYLILMGDGDGRGMAAQRDLPCVTSYSIVVELVARGILTREQGVAVARTIVRGELDEARFDADVATNAPPN